MAPDLGAASNVRLALHGALQLDRNLPEKISTLRVCFAFSGLSGEDLAELAHELVERRLKSGAILFHEDDPWTGIFMVKSGKLKTFKMAKDSREQILDFYGEGDLLGVAAAFTGDEFNLEGGRYLASAAATTDSLVYIVSKKSLENLIRRYPEVALSLIRFLGERLRLAFDLITDLSFQRVPQRVATLLLRLAEEYGAPGEGGISLNILLSRGEIAEAAGTSHETVIRILSKFSKAGLISVRKRQIVILNPRKLAEWAER